MVNEKVFELLNKIKSTIKLIDLYCSQDQTTEYLYRINNLVDEIYMLLED